MEGYDPSKFSNLGINNWNYQSFITFRKNGAINVDSDPSLTSFITLSSRLEDAGYDLIFVDFDEGTGDIIRNAYLLENIIKWVNENKINNPGSGIREKNVVLGQSMGGLIARYAVTDMEKRRIADPGNNDAHEVRLLVTQDSPHRGANVPLGFQAMVNELANVKLTKVGLASYGIIGGIVGSFLELKDIVPDLKDAEDLLNEPASKQMLVVQDGMSNTFLDGDYRNMVTFPSGYTPTFDMLAIANGSECGIDQQVIDPGGELFFADANLYVNRLLFTFASTTVANTIETISPVPGPGVITMSVLYTLIPLTGKNWKTNYIVRAAPSYGTNQAFYGRMRFEKKILFFIPVNVTLYEGSRNSQSGALPWDSAPGGYYSLQSIQPEVPENPNIDIYPIIDINLTVRLSPAFTFVPTVSALDISTSQLTNNVLTSPYNGGFNYTYPSRFDNFKTQEEDLNEPIGSFDNTRHIQFTPTNALWLFNEMEGIPNNLNCSSSCQPQGIDVSGSTTICGQETYTINELPSNYSISWAKSSNLAYVSGQNSLYYSVQVSGTTGAPWVEAHLTGQCGTLEYRKNLVRGGDGIDYQDLTIYGPDEVCENETYIFNAYNNSDIPIVEYDWIFPYGWTTLNQNNDPYYSEVEVLTPGMVSSGDGVDLAITNICGGYQPDWYKPISDNDFCYSAMIYPNPVRDYLEISEIGTESNEVKSSKGVIKEIKLYNNFQENVLSVPFNSPKTSIDVRNLSEGYYILHIIKNNSIENRVIFISRPN